MDTLEKPTIEEEIVFLTQKIHNSKLRILDLAANLRAYHPRSIPIIKARIKYPTEKLKILESLLAEQAAGWEIVFLQPQNDHDEVWKSVGPGPRIAKLIPESHKLGNLIVHLNHPK
jgi:hypothetical protein